MMPGIETSWKDVCSADDLQPDSGVCALMEGQQVAIFFVAKEKVVYAIHNYDPIGRANVLSRGVIGDIKGEPVVASPLYKQHFNLKTGICLEDGHITVPVYPVRIRNGRVEMQAVTSDVIEGLAHEKADA
ncbi:nitrite reductase small subunit NirD [Methyloglobulus sp.]|uniref:nitrite reductase small subunit NirD n=1 Tax=Methyloglobulus sp. TaxID=2518622 RepID=UPI00398A02C5